MATVMVKQGGINQSGDGFPSSSTWSQHSRRSTGSNQHCDQAMVLRNENAELRQSLLQSQERQQELEHECNFYRIKVSELTEIMQVKVTKDENPFTEMAVSKSLQNAELTMQVDRLQQELRQTKALNKKLWDQREQNKHLLLELSGIVRTLQSVPVEYTVARRPSCTSGSKDGNKNPTLASLENVKAKVENIMEDRRLLVLQCQNLERENKGKDEKLEALEAQYHLLNSLNSVRGDALSVEAVPSISRTTSHDSAGSNTSITTAESAPRKKDWDIDMYVIRSTGRQDRNDGGSTLGPPSVTTVAMKSLQHPGTTDDNTSCMTESTLGPVEVSKAAESPMKHASPVTATTTAASSPVSADSFQWNPAQGTSSMKSPNEINRLREELAESNRRYEHFKEVCQTAFEKMKTVEAEYEKVKEDCHQATSKNEELRGHLKDVIEQYKELHKEYDQVVEKLEDAKFEIKYLQKTVSELAADRERLDQQGAELLEEEGLANNVDKLVNAYLKARATIESLNQKLASAEQKVEDAEKRRSSGGRQYRDTVAQCRKLQHELKIMETRVSDAEDQIQIAKKETQKHKEDAKQTRRRLTLLMKKEGGGGTTGFDTVNDAPSSFDQAPRQKKEREALMLPELIMVPSSSFTGMEFTDQHRLLLLEAAIAGKVMSEKHKLIQDRNRLLSENEDLKAFCAEVLNDVGITT